MNIYPFSNPQTVTVTVEHYSIFTVHDTINMAMQEYYKDVNYKLNPTAPIYGQEPDYKYNKGTTEYASHYVHHIFKVSVKRNTDRYLQVSASIISKQKEHTEETHQEEDAIKEIALKGIIQLIQEHGNLMCEFEEEIERSQTQTFIDRQINAFYSENQDYYAEIDAERQSSERKEELIREHQEEYDEMYASYMDDLSSGYDA